MSNRITTQYSQFESLDLETAQNLARSIANSEGLKLEELIYIGRILDDKIGTLIYNASLISGEKKTPVVFKLVFVDQDNPEPELIERFYKQFEDRNQDLTVRLPKVYKYVPFGKKGPYFYYVMERVEGKQIEEIPIFKQEWADIFVNFYKNFKSLKIKPFFERTPQEEYSLSFILHRFFKWLKTAESMEPLSSFEYKVINEYVGYTANFLMKLPMEFTHRHLRMQDFAIIKHQSGDANPEYVIFSVAFFSYMPKFYDLTFHIWHAIEMAYKVDGYKSRNVAEYTDFIEQWLDFYKQHNLISSVDTEKAFWALMGERATGALIIDLRARKYNMKGESRKAYNHLRDVWMHVFDYCLRRFSEL